MDVMTVNNLLERAAQLDLAKVDVEDLLLLHRVLTIPEPPEEDVLKLAQLVKEIPEA